MSGNPLFETLFRPTTADPSPVQRPAPHPAGATRPAPPPTPPVTEPVRSAVSVSASVSASAAPVRVRGTRTRAGNAMDRTRGALLAGAARAVEVSGTRIAMAQVAAAAGVAKATLYNHFRTRDAVLAALVVAQVEELIERYRDAPLDEALTGAATALSEHPLRRGLAELEPATLAALGTIDAGAPAWQLARTGVETLLARHGRRGTDTVLRWLASFLLTPADDDIIAADVRTLLAGLPPALLARPA